MLKFSNVLLSICGKKCNTGLNVLAIMNMDLTVSGNKELFFYREHRLGIEDLELG